MIEGGLHVLGEIFGEGVAVIDSEDPFKEVDVDGDVEVLPGVVVGQFSYDSGDFLPFEEDSLREA